MTRKGKKKREKIPIVTLNLNDLVQVTFFIVYIERYLSWKDGNDMHKLKR